MQNNSEDESVGASPVDEIDGGSSSENVPGIQNLTLDEVTEDLISTLPDPLIQHIISFLPSTKEAIRTGILSKRWQNQWNRVPVLIFNSTGMSTENFSQSIDNTLMLHDCSKITKLHIQYDHKLDCDPQLTSKIRFAIRKNVEELILHHRSSGGAPYVLPKFVFSNVSLVKLELFNCYIVHDRCPDWPNLKELKLECSSVSPSAITDVVSGSPSLECLELTSCIEVDNVVIASKSLKKLIFVDVQSSYSERIEISCPNLEQLSVKISECFMIAWSQLPGETIENVLSSSPLLHTLELPDCGCFDPFVIASKSLKKLVLGEIYGTRDFEISCPDLEEVDLYRFVPWDLSYIIDVESGSRLERTLAMRILRQLQHVKLLEIGSWFIKHQLRGSGLNDCRKMNHWNTNETDFNYSVSNLKTFKIIGLLERDDKHKLLFQFVEFLLKNARMLDKVVVILADCRTGFPHEVSKRLLNFQRCFPHTTIELICSN